MINLGFMPMAMLYRNDEGKREREWITFQRLWANPYIVAATMKKLEVI